MYTHGALVGRSVITLSRKQASLPALLCRSASSKAQPVSAMSAAKLDELFPPVVDFPSRHIGPRKHETKDMLKMIGYETLDELTGTAVPDNIKLGRLLDLEDGYSTKLKYYLRLSNSIMPIFS